MLPNKKRYGPAVFLKIAHNYLIFFSVWVDTKDKGWSKFFANKNHVQKNRKMVCIQRYVLTTGNIFMQNLQNVKK